MVGGGRNGGGGRVDKEMRVIYEFVIIVLPGDTKEGETRRRERCSLRAVGYFARVTD